MVNWLKSRFSKIIIIAAFLLILPWHSNSQGMTFVRENISMRLSENYFYVTGQYTISGDGTNGKSLLYPLPVDALYGNVDSIYIYDLNANESISPIKIEKEMVVFKFDFNGENETIIQISYRQRIFSNKAEYIVKTTKYWSKPLVKADFQLVVPNNLQITNFKHEPDMFSKLDHEHIYYWEFYNFMPDKNMEFVFDKAKSDE